MGYYNQQQTPTTADYPLSGQAYTPPTTAYPVYVAPPPLGYPVKDGAANPQQVPVETKSRDGGFWEGCCATLCCCCVLDMCC